MTHIKLDNAHQPLIKAAIQLGDWMRSLPQLSGQDVAAIEAVQLLLKGLPELPDKTLAMYGFSIEQGDATQGLIRGWDVSIEYFEHAREQQGGLELFSSWLPIPESDQPKVLMTKKHHESYFHWPPGDICCFVQPEKAKQWLEEVSDPLACIETADRFRLEIVYQDYYSEIEIAV